VSIKNPVKDPVCQEWTENTRTITEDHTMHSDFLSRASSVMRCHHIWILQRSRENRERSTENGRD